MGESKGDATARKLESGLGQLGLPADQLSKLKSEASGHRGLSDDELEQLCARLAAKHFTQTELASIAKSLGLSQEQLQQLNSCVPPAQPSEEAGPPEQGTKGLAELGILRSPPSAIERAFAELDSATPQPESPSPQNLTQFGYSLFSRRVSTFAPVQNVPVGDDYIVGPGDELNIILWGRVNTTLHLKVQRDGSILIPEMGPVQVAGLTFAQAKKLIEGRASQITGVQTDLTMGRLRTIQVFVIGEVKQPGAYTVSALSRVSNSLVAAGGISKVGSLRRIELRRGNQIVRVVDLYDMLLHGNTAADERLESQDVIFVPVVGAVAGVVGDVKRPAIYELGFGANSVRNVLDLAGGISAFGYSHRIQVERVENHQRRAALDVNLQRLDSQGFQVRDGDLIKVYAVLPEQHNVVALKGNVNRPGKYQWHRGMRVADLVREGEGVAPHTFFKYALVRRQEGPERKVHLVPVDLSAALSDHLAGPMDLPLSPGDELTIFSQEEMQDHPTVRVFGEVRRPGTYPLNPGMKVTDLIYLAGGLKDEAYQQQAELARTEVVEGAQTRHSYVDVDLRSALAGSDVHDRELEPNDELFVRTVPLWHLPMIVTVEGEVLRPGPYTIRQGERLASVLRRCGGLLPDAYLPGVVFIRQSVKAVEQQRLKEMRDRLAQDIVRVSASKQSSNGTSDPAQYLQRVLAETKEVQAQGRLVVHLSSLDRFEDSLDNLSLEDGDRITIPKRPSSVSILGQVYNPTSIVYQPTLTVRDYLDRAGGYNENADPQHIFVIKVDGSVLSEEGVRDNSKARMFPLLPVVTGGLMSTHLEPGDTVFVPEKLFYVDNLQYAKDITQVIYQGAISLATLGLLAFR